MRSFATGNDDELDVNRCASDRFRGLFVFSCDFSFAELRLFPTRRCKTQRCLRLLVKTTLSAISCVCE